MGISFDRPGTGGGGTAGVSSFKGRTGVVSPQDNDYTASQVGAIPSSEKGVAGGVAELDTEGKIHVLQIPDISAGVEEAPIDGIAYSRKDAGWTPASSGGSGGAYTVVQREGSTSNQVYSFNFSSPQYAFDLGAYSLKQGTVAAGQNIVFETFDTSVEDSYEQTNALLWDGKLIPYTGEIYETVADGGLFSATIRSDGGEISLVAFTGRSISTLDILQDNSSILAYRFDGDALDIGGNYNAIVSGASYSPGVWGDAISLATEGIDTGYALTGQFTVSFWLYYAARPASYEAVIAQYGGPSDSLRFIIRMNAAAAVPGASSDLEIFQGGSTSPSLGFSYGEFNHILIVSDGTTIRLINRTIGQEVSLPFIGMSAATLDISGFGGERVAVNALYDQFRVLNRAVSSEEITYLFNEVLRTPVPYLVRSVAGDYYKSDGGNLTSTAEPISASDIDATGNINSITIPAQQLAGLLPLEVVTGVSASVAATYTPYNQIALEQPQPASSWLKINTTTLTTDENGTGKVSTAVSRNGTNWYAWDGTAWTSLGSLSADTTSADTVLTNGMNATTLNSLTWTEWQLLFSDTEDGSPDSLAFAYALSIPDPTTDSASISGLSMNVDFKAGWELQSPSDVKITWYNDQITFQTVNAGNYKFAYQAP